MTSLVNAAIAGIGNTSPKTAFPTSNAIAAARDVSFPRNLQNWEMTGANLDWVQSDVIEILTKYGTDAHVYLQGIGVINGLTAGNYLDSAGTTAATVDNPVGLVLDAAGSVGSELVTNGTNPINTTGWNLLFGLSSLVASGGEFLATTTVSGQAAGYNITTVVGKTYLVSAVVRRGTVGLVDLFINGVINGGNTTGTNNVTLSMYFVATATTSTIAIRGTGAVGTYYFNNVSAKEVTGIHATQATTANKPILRQSSGLYSWQFVDSTDDLKTSAITLLNNMDCFVAINRFDSKVMSTFYNGVNSSSFTFMVMDGTAARPDIGSGTPTYLVNGVPVASTRTALNSAVTAGVFKVVEANNLDLSSASWAAFAWGNYGSGYSLVGNVGAIILCPALTASERVIIRRFVGQLSGVTI